MSFSTCFYVGPAIVIHSVENKLNFFKICENDFLFQAEYPTNIWFPNKKGYGIQMDSEAEYQYLDNDVLENMLIKFKTSPELIHITNQLDQLIPNEYTIKNIISTYIL